MHELLMLFKDLVNNLIKQQDAGQWDALDGDSCSSICSTADAGWLGLVKEGLQTSQMAKLSHRFNLHKPRLHYNDEPQLQEEHTGDSAHPLSTFQS